MFSSPIGDFVIYTFINNRLGDNSKFSSPIGDFVIYTVTNNLYEI